MTPQRRLQPHRGDSP